MFGFSFLKNLSGNCWKTGLLQEFCPELLCLPTWMVLEPVIRSFYRNNIRKTVTRIKSLGTFGVACDRRSITRAVDCRLCRGTHVGRSSRACINYCVLINSIRSSRTATGPLVAGREWFTPRTRRRCRCRRRTMQTIFQWVTVVVIIILNERHHASDRRVK